MIRFCKLRIVQFALQMRLKWCFKYIRWCKYTHALIMSWLDYGSDLFYCLLSTMMEQLDTHTHKHEHITPVLNVLHWLPAIYRLQYKILVYLYNGLYGTAPQYLLMLIIWQDPWDQSLKHSCLHANGTCFDSISTGVWDCLPKWPPKTCSQTRCHISLSYFYWIQVKHKLRDADV